MKTLLSKIVFFTAIVLSLCSCGNKYGENVSKETAKKLDKIFSGGEALLQYKLPDTPANIYVLVHLCLNKEHSYEGGFIGSPYDIAFVKTGWLIDGWGEGTNSKICNMDVAEYRSGNWTANNEYISISYNLNGETGMYYIDLSSYNISSFYADKSSYDNKTDGRPIQVVSNLSIPEGAMQQALDIPEEYCNGFEQIGLIAYNAIVSSIINHYQVLGINGLSAIMFDKGIEAIRNAGIGNTASQNGILSDINQLHSAIAGKSDMEIIDEMAESYTGAFVVNFSLNVLNNYGGVKQISRQAVVRQDGSVVGVYSNAYSELYKGLYQKYVYKEGLSGWQSLINSDLYQKYGANQ